MAEEVVVKEQLSEEMIEGGEDLLKAVDEAGLEVVAAFWLYKPEINDWRLYFAMPDVRTQGSPNVHLHISRILADIGDDRRVAPLSALGLLEPEAKLVQRFRTGSPTGPGISRVRFSRNVIDGHYIEDALIYRAC